MIEYERPLLREGGRIADIGDMLGVEAQDTLHVEGLYIVPLEEALDEDGGLNTGVPAFFLVTEDPEGRRVRFRFEGRPPN